MVEITVCDAHNVPDRTHLSVRVGEVRRQMQFKPGSRFKFEVEESPRSFVLDVFQKVGSAQVCIDELVVAKGTEAPVSNREGSVDVLLASGSRMAVDLKVAAQAAGQSEVRPSSDSEPKSFPASPGEATNGVRKSARQASAKQAKTYLDSHEVQKMLQSMVHHLLEAQPGDPLDFMIDFLKDSQKRSRAMVRAQTKAKTLSMTEDEPPGFPSDGSQPLPDISRHHSLLAVALSTDPGLYGRMSQLKTSTGVRFAKCIKSSVDNPGHAMLRTPGIWAADVSSYEVFAEAFDPVIAAWHNDYSKDSVHPTDLDMSKMPSMTIDDSHIDSVQVVGLRNLNSQRFPTACTYNDRCNAEELLTEAFSSLTGSLEGVYMPFCGSDTVRERLGGMSDKEESLLRMDGISVEQPDSAMQRSAGLARHWPHARGVYRASSGELVLQVNDTDHLRIRSQCPGGDFRRAWDLFHLAEKTLGEALQRDGHCFARTSHLGFLTSCPSNLGTGMLVRVILSLPLLSQVPNFQAYCKQLGLSARWHMPAGLARAPSKWEVGSAPRLGVSEVDQMTRILTGCQALVDMEKQLEDGEVVILDPGTPLAAIRQDLGSSLHEPEVLNLEEEVVGGGEAADAAQEYGYVEGGDEDDWEESDHDGLGEMDCPGFPVDECPEEQPDLSHHHSLMAKVLEEDKTIYPKLRSRTTKLGVTLARCIKTGVDAPGHAFMTSIGVMAGDAECYDVFRELFDPVVDLKHREVGAAAKPHVTDMDCRKVTTTFMDPTHRHVVSVKASFSRNVEGFRMPSACSFEERQDVERVLTQALLNSGEVLEGDYYALRGSNTYADQPEGMSQADEARLRQAGHLFEDPDSQVLLSAGFGRHWPHGRGVYCSKGGSFYAWINEENHLRFDAFGQTEDLKNVFESIVEAHQHLERSLRDAGLSFSKSDRLGYLTTCPATVGTGLTIVVTMSLPQLFRQGQISHICDKLGVSQKTHWSAGLHRKSEKGCYDVASVAALGSTEVEQANLLIEACRVLVELEKGLDEGVDIDFAAEPEATIAKLGPLAQDLGKQLPPWTPAAQKGIWDHLAAAT